MASRLSSLLLIASVTVAGLSAGGCSSLLYYPSQNQFVIEQSKLNPPPQDMYFGIPSGPILHAWYFQNATGNKTKATIILFHGNAQNITSHFASLFWLMGQPYDLLVFDYPGYGKSQGKPSPKNTVEAGVAAVNWAKTKTPHQPLVIYGQSLGGTIAIRTLQELGAASGVSLLVLDSTFLSYRSAGQYMLKKAWLTWPLQWVPHLLLSDKWGPKKNSLGDLSYLKNILVLHADRDPVIDFRLGEKLFRALPEPKTFWKVPSAGHIDTYFRFGVKYRKELSDWLAAALKDP